jgi:hypothetical protein
MRGISWLAAKPVSFSRRTLLHGLSKYVSKGQQINVDDAGYILRTNCLLNTLTGKAVPLQAWSGPEGSRKLRFPDFITTAQDGGKIVSLTHRPPLPQEIHQVIISFRDCVNPRAIVRPEGLCHWKISMTPSEIEPATCRFVAYCLNHYATARLL